MRLLAMHRVDGIPPQTDEVRFREFRRNQPKIQMEDGLNGTSLLLGTALLSAALVATTSNLAQDGGSTAQSAAPHVDFVYRLGHTTLDEARAYWSQNGMKIVGAGHLALGGGSGMDRAGRVSTEKVLLVDVSGVDFEGISNARFGFYGNTLYRIQATLTPILLKGSTATSYTDEQMKA